VSEFDTMVEQMVAMRIPRPLAEATARRELGLPGGLTDEQLQAREERLEKTIELEGDKQMRALGFEVVKFSHPGKTKQTLGIPDRRYYHRGRRLVLWWEAKSATGIQRPDQKLFQEMCEACGEIYVLGTDDDLFLWLIKNGIAARTAGDLLIGLPYGQELRSA
jgi:hypothetical protein